MRSHALAQIALRAFLILALVAVGLVASTGQRAAAVGMTRSQNIAIVPNAGGQNNFGGELPTTIAGQPGVPTGYAPAFTNVSSASIMDGTITDPLIGFDTVVLVGICDIATKLADPDFKSRIEAFVTAGGKLIIWDSECTSTNYGGFVYPFTTNNPGARGANGVLTDAEENTLSSASTGSSSYVNDAAVSSGTDAVGDANVFVTFNQNWCVDLKATNTNGIVGPVQTYARLGSGLIIYDGLDKDAMSNNSPSFDPASASGSVHLQRIWLLNLLQPFSPDGLPCGVKVFGLSLTPQTATNPVGTSHTVTAHVSVNGAPQTGVTVTFAVTAGPNTGVTGTGVTSQGGDATFTYTSNGTPGTDTISATATVSGNDEVPTTIRDSASKTWTGGTTPTQPPSAQVTAASPSCGQAVITGTGITPGLPHQIVVTPSGGGTPIVVNVTADASQTVTATITVAGGGSFTAFVRNASNQVTVTNTAIFTVAACAAPTPTPTPTPTPARPTPTPTPTPTPAPIANLPSTATGGDIELPIAGLAAITIALAAFAVRRRISAI